MKIVLAFFIADTLVWNVKSTKPIWADWLLVVTMWKPCSQGLSWSFLRVALKSSSCPDNVFPSALPDTKEDVIFQSNDNFAMLSLMG